MAELFLPCVADLADQVVSGHSAEPHEPDNLLRTLVSQVRFFRLGSQIARRQVYRPHFKATSLPTEHRHNYWPAYTG